MPIAYMIIYITACLMLSCTVLIFTILFNHAQHVYYVYSVPYMQVSSHRANLFSQHMALCCKSFHSLILHVLRCTVNDLHHYHSSIVCESTSGYSTPTTLRGCVLPNIHIEYYVIALLHPWVQSIPYYYISPYCALWNLNGNCADHV